MAKSLEVLRKQIDAQWPSRNKASDGGIGDAAHATRTSDHNPWITDKPGPNVVSARDFTQWNGIVQGIVDALVASRDKRIKYIIWNGRIICSYDYWRNGKLIKAWTWATYNGSNPHTKHFHISVWYHKNLYDDTSPWAIGGATGKAEPSNKKEEDDMANYAEQLARIEAIVTENQRRINTVRSNTGPIKRGGKDVSLRQEVADIKTAILSLNVKAAVAAALKEANIDADEDAIAEKVAANLVSGLTVEATVKASD